MKTKLLVVSFVVLALLTACGRATPTPTPAPAPGAPTPTPRATPTPPPAAPTALVPTGELRIATASLEMEILDPSLGAGGDLKLYPFHDFLVGATPEGQLSKETGIAENWEISHSATGSTYTFYIRKGVKFHNGDELTAEDVKFTIEHFMRPASISTQAGMLRDVVNRVEAVERYKVLVYTKKPFGLLHILLSPLAYGEGQVLPKKYYQEKGGDYFIRAPVGSGPYRFKEQQLGSYVRFEAVDRHWRLGVPKYKTLTYYIVPEESTRIALVKTGQADIVEISREQVKAVQAAGFKTFFKPGAWVVMIWQHNLWEKEIYLYDKRVREALNLAVNREEILKYIFEGQGEIVANGYYGTWALGFKPFPPYPYDPERAKGLLKEAFPGGVELTFNSFNRPGVPEMQKMNEAIAAMWEKVGVRSKILPMEYTAHRAKWVKAETKNTVAGARSPNRLDWGSAWRAVLHSKGTLPLVKDPQMDALIEAAEAETDPEKLAPRQQEAARYIRENHFIVPLLETGSVFAARPEKVGEWYLGMLPYDYNIHQLIARR